jgi:predicted esterase
MCELTSLKYPPPQMARQDAASLPIFWGFGLADRLVHKQINTTASDFLVRDVGIRCTEDLGGRGLMSRSYEGMGHETNAQERKDLETFIKKIVP